MDRDPEGLNSGQTATPPSSSIRSTRRARPGPDSRSGAGPETRPPSDATEQLALPIEPEVEEPQSPPADVGPGPADPIPDHVHLEVVERFQASADERRRQLWRDSATILIGVVLALLVGQAVFPPATGPGASPTPLPSGVVLGSFGPQGSLPPGVTFGPIVPPSLAIDATPTPIPVITMGPPTPSPSPSPSGSPSLAPVPSFTWIADALTVTFTNTSTGIVKGETTWLWDFGDGATGGAKNPASHTYAADGEYTVSLTMTTVYGTDSFEDVVTVMTVAVSPNPSPGPSAEVTPAPSSPPTPAPPTVAFDWSPTSPAPGESVTFTNLSSGGSTYLWEFGDGDTSTEVNPMHTYLADCTCTVTLTVTGPGGQKSLSQQIDVVTPAP